MCEARIAEATVISKVDTEVRDVGRCRYRRALSTPPGGESVSNDRIWELHHICAQRKTEGSWATCTDTADTAMDQHNDAKARQPRKGRPRYIGRRQDTSGEREDAPAKIAREAKPARGSPVVAASGGRMGLNDRGAGSTHVKRKDRNEEWQAREQGRQTRQARKSDTAETAMQVNERQ